MDEVGGAGDTARTSRQGCVGRTGRQSQQRVGIGERGSSTSSGEEDKKDAEIEELRATIEHYRKPSGGAEQRRARPSTQKRKWHGGSVENGC